MQGLQELADALRVLTSDDSAASFSKYQRLLEHLHSAEFGWQKHDATDRL